MEIVVPSERYRRSYLAADQEFVAAGSVWDGKFIATEDTFANMLAGIERARPSLVELWLVEGDDYVGKIQLRPDGVPDHIGIAIRPAARQRGVAGRALELARPHARALGIAYLTAMCAHDNVAALALVARFGGVLEDDRGDDQLRFRIAI